jgi:hypothetical protein
MIKRLFTDAVKAYRDIGRRQHARAYAWELELLAEGWTPEEAAKRTQLARSWGALIYTLFGGALADLDRERP